MGSVERKLRRLFDFQKYEKEPKLDGVIDGVKNSYSDIRKLTDDELEFAAGGMGQTVGGNEIDDPQANGRCKIPHCGGYLRKTTYGYICTECGQQYDKNKKPINFIGN